MYIGIISSEFVGYRRDKEVPYEATELISFAKKRSEIKKLLIIDPSLVRIGIQNNRPAITYSTPSYQNEDIDLAQLDCLIVRRTRGYAEQIYDYLLFFNKTNPTLLMFDPVDSYLRPLSKVDGFMRRLGHFNQIDTVILPSTEVKPSDIPVPYPFVVKPTHGYKGIDVELCENRQQFSTYLQGLQEDPELQMGYGLLLQPYKQFDNEFRVVVVGGKGLGCASKKQPDPNIIASNAERGGVFQNSPHRSDVVKLAEECTRISGLSFSGVDVVEIGDQLYILECNRNPQFREFDRACDLQTGAAMIDHVLQCYHKEMERRQMAEVRKPRVFIGSSSEGHEIAEFIQVGLERFVDCKIWDQGLFQLSLGNLENLERSLDDFDFAILVLTPDDLAVKRGVEARSPRDNVLFELGLFMGKLGRDRTFMVYQQGLEMHLPSDLAGISAATFPQRSDADLQAAVGSACTKLKSVILRIE
jgi:predicted nucleotide-binding protein